MARIHLPDLQDQLEEFNRMSRRYHAYWPEGDFVSSAVPGSPEKVLGNALKHLKAWESDASVFIQKYAPLRDPVEFVVKGAHVSLRCEEAAMVIVDPQSIESKKDE